MPIPQAPARQYPGSRRNTCFSQPPAGVRFGIGAPASPAHRPRCQQAFVFRGLAVLSGSQCQVPTPNPPGTYEISAHLLLNSALRIEEGAGPEIQVVTSDPSSSHARGQAQATESLKPRKQQKPGIRESNETAAFQNRIPLNSQKGRWPKHPTSAMPTGPPKRHQGNIHDLFETPKFVLRLRRMFFWGSRGRLRRRTGLASSRPLFSAGWWSLCQVPTLNPLRYL